MRLFGKRPKAAKARFSLPMWIKARFDAAADEADKIRIEQAARWGLAAMDNAEEVVQHEDP